MDVVFGVKTSLANDRMTTVIIRAAAAAGQMICVPYCFTANAPISPASIKPTFAMLCDLAKKADRRFLFLLLI